MKTSLRNNVENDDNGGLIDDDEDIKLPFYHTMATQIKMP